MKEVLELIKEFLIFCSGADIEIVKETQLKSEENKYATIGAVIVAISILASCSGGFAARTFFGRNQNQLLPFIAGAIWGLFIFAIDRYFSMSIKKKYRDRKINARWSNPIRWIADLCYSTLPIIIRIAFSVILSSVIAMPLEAEMFQSSIQLQIARTDRNEIQSIRIDAQDKKVKLSEKIQTELDSISEEIISLNREKIVANKQFQKELEGKGDSSRPGKGPSSDMYESQIKTIDKKINKLDERKSSLQTDKDTGNKIIDEEALQEIQLIKGQSETIETTTKNKKTLEKTQYIPGVVGLEKKLKALEEISKNPAIGFWKWLTTAALMIIEIAPVSMKILFPYGPYDAILETREKRLIFREEQIKENLNDEISKDLAAEEVIRNAARDHRRDKVKQENEQIYNIDASKRRKTRELQQSIFNRIIKKAKTKLFDADWIDVKVDEIVEQLFGKQSKKKAANKNSNKSFEISSLIGVVGEHPICDNGITKLAKNHKGAFSIDFFDMQQL
jgi:hypothetical protein